MEVAGRIGLNHRNELAVFDILETFQKGAACRRAAPILASVVSPRFWTHRNVVTMS